MRKVIFLLLYLFLFCASSYSEQKGAIYHILYVNSYHVGYTWSDDVMRGVVSSFSERDSFMVHARFLDTRRSFSPLYVDATLEGLKRKYGNFKFDIIIASDNAALDWVLLNRQDSFLSDIPIVFCGISNPNDYPIKELDLYGVVEGDLFQNSYETIHQLCPFIKHIYFICDKTESGLIYSQNAKNLFSNNKEVELVVVDDLNISDIEKVIGKIGYDGIIYYAGVSIDGDGVSINDKSFAKRIVTNSKVPVFYGSAKTVDGVVGGAFFNGFEHGKICASLAEKRLKGIIPKEKIVFPDPRWHFDYNQLVYRDFDFDLLPKNTIILNEPETVWHRYRRFVLINIAIIAFLALLVLVLFRYNKQHAKAKGRIKAAMTQAQEADRLKGAFLANVSHELRTPLNAICGFSELIKEESKDSELSSYVDVIYSNSQILSQLVNDLLDVSLIDANVMPINKHMVDIEPLFAKLIEQANSLLIVKNKVHVNVELVANSDLRYLFTDDFRVQQILINFINNAAKYTDFGKIVLGYEHASDVVNRFELNLPHLNYAVLYVEDTGVGIAKEKTQYVFDRFRSVDSKYISQHGGVGLGLNIAKSLAELLGGTIFVFSESGKGSVFGITLPLEYE